MKTARAPKQPAPKGMTKAEACKVLHVASTADEEFVTQAYTHLAQKYRLEAGRDADARERMDELGRAFLVLHPNAKVIPLSAVSRPAEPPITAEVAAKVGQVVRETRVRWDGRAPEIAVITTTTAVLGFLALSAGAAPLWTLLALAIAFLTIWAPWRRT